MYGKTFRKKWLEKVHERKIREKKEAEIEREYAYQKDVIRNNKKAMEQIRFSSAPRIKLIVAAYENDKIREDEELLNLILSMFNWQMMEQMLLACENDAIRENMEILYQIASQNTMEKMFEARKAFEKEVIKENKEAEIERKYAYQKDVIRNNKKAMEQIRFASAPRIRLIVAALKNDKIREDEEALNLILSQPRWQKTEQILLACENDAIRENKEILNQIASQDTWENMYDARKAFEKEIIKKNKEAENCTDIDDSIKSEEIVDSSVEDLKVKTIKLTDNN